MNKFLHLIILIMSCLIYAEIYAQPFEDNLFAFSIITQKEMLACTNDCCSNTEKNTVLKNNKFYNLNDDLAFFSRLAIRVYQTFISSQNQPSCMFEPSCSAFATEAINSFGIRGLFLSADRVSRCNGWGYQNYMNDYKNGVFYDPPSKYIRSNQ